MTSILSTVFAVIVVVFPVVGIAAQDMQSPSLLPRTPLATIPNTHIPTPDYALEEALKKQRASLERQMQAIHAQLGEKATKTVVSAPVEQFITPLQTSSQPDCPAIDNGKLNDLVSSAAQKHSIDPAILKAVMKQESAFKPCAVSMKGAQGLMQLMPATARELHVNDAFDPVQNVHAGAAYLRQLLDRYKGDLRLALIGYNAGPGRADQGMETPLPVETQSYVASIFADLNLDQNEVSESREDLAPADITEESNAPPKK